MENCNGMIVKAAASPVVTSQYRLQST